MNCSNCHRTECECWSYELVPTLSYSTWGEYYLFCLWDRYYDLYSNKS
jgi:hypothetical protein